MIKLRVSWLRWLTSITLVVAVAWSAQAQDEDDEEEEDVITLSPFEVNPDEDIGYRATNTLTGTRTSTRLEDVGSSISVLTKELLEDVGATDNESALIYTVNAEIGGPRGNFSGSPSGLRGDRSREEGTFDNPNSNTRVRGLTSVDQTRNFFINSVPWNGYTVDRVDIQRGPNSMLFGLGSASGVVNATTKTANFGPDSGEVKVRLDQFGSFQVSLDYNTTVIEDELAVRVAALYDDRNFRQDPAFQKDERFFTAFKYTPAALNSDSTLFEFSGNFERGSIRANRPRTVPPYDDLSSFFRPESEFGVDRETFDLTDLVDRAADEDNTAVTTGFSSAVTVAGDAGSIGTDFVYGRIFGIGARDADGNVVLDNDGLGYLGGSANLHRLADRQTWLSNAGGAGFISDELAFWRSANATENRVITDTSVFDFFNNSFEGPNKGEFRDWHIYDLNLTNTFFDNKLSYKITYHREENDFFKYGTLGWTNRFLVDINESIWDIDVDDDGNLFSHSGPNPNVGRPYVEEDLRFNTSSSDVERENFRFQLTAQHDFTDSNEGFLGKLLGNHSVSYLYETQEEFSDRREYNPVAWENGVSDLLEGTSENTGNNNHALVTLRYYLSDEDLRGRTSAAGLNLTGMSEEVLSGIVGQRQLRYFNNTWIGGTDFGAEWINPEGEVSTQSENPANYQGWTTESFQLLNILHPDDTVLVDGRVSNARDFLVKGNDGAPTLIDTETTSNVLIYQGYFWQDAVVVSYGYREDEQSRDRFDYISIADGEFDPSEYFIGSSAGDTLSGDDEAESTNWSVALHLDRLLGDNDFLPFNLSLYYNEGENTQPAAGRIDDFGMPIPSPTGETEEVSIGISTKDKKYSLRVVDFETRIVNGVLTSGLANDWTISQMLWSSAQRRAEINNGTFDFENNTRGIPEAEFLATVVPAYDAFVDGIDEQFGELIPTWSRGESSSYRSLIDDQDGFVFFFRNGAFDFKEDNISVGKEYEFVANPVEGWNITINASQTTAIRDNAPGERFLDLISFIRNAVEETPAGDFPTFGGLGFQQYLNSFRWGFINPAFIQLEALNGQEAPDVREWRYNVVTNYKFNEGKFKGFGVGGSYRYEEPYFLEYPPVQDASGAITFDLENPILGPEEETFDLWASYETSLNDNVDWKLQLHLYNAFGKNELLPISVDPNGDVNAARIREGKSWAVTNTFSF